MKKIMYFILGFTVSTAFVLNLAHAAYDYSTPHELGDYCPQNMNDANVQAAIATVEANANYRAENSGAYAATYYIFKNTCTTPAGYSAIQTQNFTAYTVITFSIRTGAGTADNPFVYNRFMCIKFNTGYVPANNPGDCSQQTIDTDNDGIPDECDFYPTDSTPYKISLRGYQTSDNTSGGSHTYERYVTDRNDLYEIGSEYDSAKHLWLRFSTVFVDPPTDCGSSVREQGSSPTELENPDISVTPPDGSPETNTDSEFESGVKSEGTETDNAALRGIMDNTAKTATGIDRLGDYIKDMNRAIQNMDRNNIAGSGKGTSDGQVVADKIDEKAAEDDTEANSSKDSFSNQSDSHTYDGTLTEGTDYPEIGDGDLQGETWLTNIINDNPIKAWVDASGFEYANEVCSMSFVHPRFGNLSFSLCEFESTFDAAGNILFSLCGLYGLILIIKG